MAQEKTNQQISAMFNMADFRQQAQNNIKEQYRWLTTTMGADGLYDAYKNDPRQLGFLENTLGLAPGGLAAVASKARADRQLEQQYKQAQISNIYSEIGARTTKNAGNAAAVQQMQLDTADTVLTKIGEANNILSGMPGAGLIAGLFSKVGGTKPYTLNQTMDTIKSNITFDKLQEMRNNSPTGGAVGNVSDSDLRLLGNTVASLDISQDKKTIQNNLKQVQDKYVDIIQRMGYIYDPETGAIVTP